MKCGKIHVSLTIKLVSVLGREIHNLGRDRDSTEQAISAETEISVDHYL